jgi:hypothetical protein
MSIFSLNWFKSRKQQELDELKVEEQRIKNELLRKELYTGGTKTEAPEEKTFNWTINTSNTSNIESAKPYKNIKLVNDMLTIVLNDGSIITKAGATNDDFMYARNASTEDQLLALVATQEIVAERKKHEAEVARAKAIRQGVEKLAQLEDFRIEGDSVYLVGIDRSLPQLLVEEFLLIANKCWFNQELIDKDEEFQSLKRFFMWCCLNPRAEVANELYRFLKENSFRITKQGFFVALRNVVTLHGSNELVQFVSNAYNKVKAVWKKSPDNYNVILQPDGTYRLIAVEDMFKTEDATCDYCDGEGVIYDEYDDDSYPCDECEGSGESFNSVKNYEGEDLGILTALYLDLPNRAENRFTDDWTKTFDIRIGRVVNMPMKECNWSTQDCAAAGLHFTSDQIHYVGCGDQSVLVLINPMKVVGIGQHKGRCYEYLPIMTVPREEATSILHDLDFDTLALDEDYAIRELENLTEKAKDGFVAESKKHEFNIPHISTREIENIVASLDEMKSEISKRIVSLD